MQYHKEFLKFTFGQELYEHMNKQDNHPAGNRKRCTACGITCPSVTWRGVPYPVLARWRYPSPDLTRGVPEFWLGGTPSWPGWEYPILYCLAPPPNWDWGTPRKGPGTSHWNAPERTWDQWKYYGNGVPPRKDMGPVEVFLDGDGGTPPPTWTDTCENITSRRTTYAGGN